MVGPLRFQHLGAVYHVMARCHGGKVVFQTDDDGMVLLKRLEGTVFLMKTISVAVILLLLTPLSWGTESLFSLLLDHKPGSRATAASEGFSELPDVELFGERFSAYQELNSDKGIRSVGLYLRRNHSDPSSSHLLGLFNRIKGSIVLQSGEAQAIESPNFQDATERTGSLYSWNNGGSILTLEIVRCPSRTEINIQHSDLDYFTSNLGADTGAYLLPQLEAKSGNLSIPTSAPILIDSKADDSPVGQDHQTKTEAAHKPSLGGGAEPPQRDLRFRLTKIAQAPREAEKIEYPKFRAGGSGTRGAIRDQNGNPIWRATEENPVYSISVSPDDEKIVAGAGDGKAYVITNKGEKISDLPQFPPEKDMLGMGNWVWLDNHRLLGESGFQKIDGNGKPIGCCQGHNVSESRFFIYDLRTKTMNEMQLPEELRGKVVTIRKVLKSGEIHLGHEGDGFGWYQVADLEQAKR